MSLTRIALLALLLCSPVICSAQRGVWWDYSEIQASNVDFEISALKKLGIERVHIEVSEPIFNMGLHAHGCKADAACSAKLYTFGFDKWPQRTAGAVKLPDFIAKLKKSGMQVVLMVWPVPTRAYIESLGRLEQFVARNPVHAIELEAEENWSLKFAAGDFSSLHEASVAILQRLRSGLPPDTKIWVTTAPRDFKLDAFKHDAHLFRSADAISYQTYQNVCSNDGFRCSRSKMSGGYEPGKMQQRAIETFHKISGPATRLILGLPAYDQASPIATGEHSMLLALRGSICGTSQMSERFIGSSYWSWRNIKPKSRDSAYAKRFLLYCKPDLVRNLCASATLPELQDICPGIAG